MFRARSRGGATLSATGNADLSSSNAGEANQTDQKGSAQGNEGSSLAKETACLSSCCFSSAVLANNSSMYRSQHKKKHGKDQLFWAPLKRVGSHLDDDVVPLLISRRQARSTSVSVFSLLASFASEKRVRESLEPHIRPRIRSLSRHTPCSPPFATFAIFESCTVEALQELCKVTRAKQKQIQPGYPAIRLSGCTRPTKQTRMIMQLRMLTHPSSSFDRCCTRLLLGGTSDE
ncbi:uncharacterized protein UBRO_20048 [Ustilago bromivora]|uniref:Uncharacterized protein n=1 Tax=Ustilago bromivora TaxID=307758 RepID=A0A1K0G131_9BASI|nr:uncharacterized protein UBRO_20048 [Ustilago bromivora]